MSVLKKRLSVAKNVVTLLEASFAHVLMDTRWILMEGSATVGSKSTMLLILYFRYYCVVLSKLKTSLLYRCHR